MVCPSCLAGLAKNGRFHECHQYFLRSAYRAVHDPAAPLDAQTETTDCRVRNTKDVSVLRIYHISIKSTLLGVGRGKRLGTVVCQRRLLNEPSLAQVHIIVLGGTIEAENNH